MPAHARARLRGSVDILVHGDRPGFFRPGGCFKLISIIFYPCSGRSSPAGVVAGGPAGEKGRTGVLRQSEIFKVQDRALSVSSERSRRAGVDAGGPAGEMGRTRVPGQAEIFPSPNVGFMGV